MKTIPEWKAWATETGATVEQFIAAIQQDAVKHGMTLAAYAVENDPSCEKGRNASLNTILTTRDNLQLP